MQRAISVDIKCFLYEMKSNFFFWDFPKLYNCFKPWSYLKAGINTTPKLQVLNISNLQQIQGSLNILG